MNKRGISAVVAVVLIILITVAAITIIWSVIIPLVKNIDATQEMTDLSVSTSDGFTAYDKVNKIACAQLVRGVDSASVLGAEIIFSFKGNSIKSIISPAPKNNQAKVYCFNFTGKDAPESVSAAPIVANGKGYKVLAVTSLIDKMPSGNLISYKNSLLVLGVDQIGNKTASDLGIGNCVPQCSGKNCGSNGCGGSCGSCTSPQTCVSGVCTTPECAPSLEYGDWSSCENNVQTRSVHDANGCSADRVESQACGACSPSCSAKTCGDDGCGGSCGSCVDGQTCVEGSCVSGSSCSRQANCGGNGDCNSDGSCNCDSGYGGSHCGCYAPGDCNGNGVCNSLGGCDCNAGYGGSDCSSPASSGSCVDDPVWSGLACYNYGESDCLAHSLVCQANYNGGSCSYSECTTQESCVADWNSYCGGTWIVQGSCASDSRCEAFAQDADGCVNAGCSWWGSGCYAHDDSCSSVTDENECNSYFGCSWSGGSGYCSGGYGGGSCGTKKDCEATHNCGATWTGGFGSCSNAGSCSGIGDQNSCNSYFGCYWQS